MSSFRPLAAAAAAAILPFLSAASVLLAWRARPVSASATAAEADQPLPQDAAKQQLPPIVSINTWAFSSAAAQSWSVLLHGGSALDAVEKGCSECEAQQCDGTVGFGGSPDEDGETTLDAMIMDGWSLNVGAVGCLRRIKPAIGVARKVLEHTQHTLLVGEKATQFALQMNFTEEPLDTQHSKQIWQAWKDNDCQPNFWTNVSPDASGSCGPYSPGGRASERADFGGSGNHDTIGMIAIDAHGGIAAGTSTNGASHKIPGRVGDSPIAGAGAYADASVGGAAATGDGDVMMRFLPAFVAVEAMRQGVPPHLAAQTAVDRIAAKHPDFMGAVIAITKEGIYGAACNGIRQFPFSVANEELGGVRVITINCDDDDALR